LKQFANVKAEVDRYMKRWSDMQQADLPALQKAAERHGVKALMIR